MSKETAEELRKKLMQDERVQHMIRLRAYEIYQMRGHHPGNQAQDWFQAESEVIAFLLADDGEPERQNETKAGPASESTEPIAAAAPIAAATPIKPRTRRTTASAKPVAKKASSSKQSKSKIPAETKPKRTRKQPKPENPPK